MSSCEEHLAKSAARTTWFGWHFCDCLSHILKEKDQCSSGVNTTHEQYATTTTITATTTNTTTSTTTGNATTTTVTATTTTTATTRKYY